MSIPKLIGIFCCAGSHDPGVCTGLYGCVAVCTAALWRRNNGAAPGKAAPPSLLVFSDIFVALVDWRAVNKRAVYMYIIFSQTFFEDWAHTFLCAAKANEQDTSVPQGLASLRSARSLISQISSLSVEAFFSQAASSTDVKTFTAQEEPKGFTASRSMTEGPSLDLFPRIDSFSRAGGTHRG
jgi:hypothetical protein